MSNVLISFFWVFLFVLDVLILVSLWFVIYFCVKILRVEYEWNICGILMVLWMKGMLFMLVLKCDVFDVLSLKLSFFKNFFVVMFSIGRKFFAFCWICLSGFFFGKEVKDFSMEWIISKFKVMIFKIVGCCILIVMFIF